MPLNAPIAATRCAVCLAALLVFASFAAAEDVTVAEAIAAAADEVAEAAAEVIVAEDVAVELIEPGVDVVVEQVPEGLRPANKDDDEQDDKRGAVTRDADGYAINWINLSNSADIDVANGSTTASINLHGQLQIPPDRNPAAYIIRIDEVLDTRGKSLMNRKLSKWSGQSQHWPVQRINQNNHNQSQWSMSANLSGLVGWSTSIDRVSGKVFLLEVTETKVVDLALSPGEKFTKLAGDVSIKIKKVERQSNSLTVRYAISSPHPQALDDLASPPFFWKQSLLDEEGNEIMAGPSYSNRSSSNEGYLRFYMQNAQAGPKSVRFTLAVDADERELAFDLRDLRMNPEPPPEAEPDAKPAPEEEAKPDAPAADGGEAEPVKPAPKPDPPVRKGIGGQVFE